VEAIPEKFKLRADVDGETYRKLRLIAATENTTLAEIVRVAIKDWIEANCKEK
jgi:hypothetical protein